MITIVALGQPIVIINNIYYTYHSFVNVSEVFFSVKMFFVIIRNVDEITSPTMHHSFMPSLTDLPDFKQAQKY